MIKELLTIVLFLVVFMVTLVLLTTAGVVVVEWSGWPEQSCRDKAGVMGVEHHYTSTTGCMVRVDGIRFEPLEWQRSVRSQK